MVGRVGCRGNGGGDEGLRVVGERRTSGMFKLDSGRM